MTLTFPDGSVGVVAYLANGDKSFPKERLEVFGGGRVAVLEDFRALLMTHNGRQKRMRLWAQDKGHAAEMQAFIRAIREGSRRFRMSS